MKAKKNQVKIKKITKNDIDNLNMDYFKKRPITIKAKQMTKAFTVDTLEHKNLVGKKGDYLIQGVKGELYPCRKDIFEETYVTVKRDDPEELIRAVKGNSLDFPNTLFFALPRDMCVDEIDIIRKQSTRRM